jgi:hypothetical protein
MVKKDWVGRLFVHALCVAFLCLTCQGARAPASAAERGTATSDGAAGLEGRDDAGGAFTLRGWRPTAEFIARSALADTTEVEFPGEEDGEKHLVRDVAVFIMVAAFVGYFIAEVFLKSEPDETTDDGGGKIIPSTSLAR